MLVDILNEQSQHIDTYLIIINTKYDEKILNRISKKVKIIYINRPQGSKSPLHILKIWLTLIKINPKIIHCHSPNLINLLLLFKYKCIFTVHNIGESVKGLQFYKKIFAISKAVKSDLKKRGNLESELIYNGINFEIFATKKNYHINEEENFNIVQVGRLLHEQKGQDIIINIIHELVKKQKIKNLKLYIIGDGPSQDFLMNLCNSLGLDNEVIFLGPKDRSWLYDNLCQYHALIQPSRFEGFGLTLLEASAAGLPIIASNIQGPAEILQNVSSSYLYEKENMQELAERILMTMDDYKTKKIEKKCKESLQKLQEKFSVITTANNYLKAYQKIIK